MEYKNTDELKDLEYIGSGTFGRVFRSGDKKIKIFRDKIKIDGGWLCDNPALKNHRLKNWLLIRRNKKIKYTDLISDVIHIGGIFKGTLSKFQRGITLVKARLELSFEQKKDVANELTKNVNELTNNKIYPLDLKLNNVLYDEGNKSSKVRLIDLDDNLTRVTLLPSYRLQRKSSYELKNTIINLFSNPTYECLPTSISNRLEAYRLRDKYKSKKEYSANDYIRLLNKKRKFFFIKDDVDIYEAVNRLLKYPSIHDFDIVLLVSKVNTKKIEEILDTFKKAGLNIFDIYETSEDSIYPFMNNYNSEDYFMYTNDEFSFNTGVLVKK